MNELTYYIDKYFAENQRRRASPDNEYIQQPPLWENQEQEETNAVNH